MKILTKIVVTAFALLITTKLLSGVVVEGLGALFLASVALGIVNALVRPILIILTLPVTILTLGLSIILINGFLFYSVATFVPGFTVDSFIQAILGSLLVSIISIITNKFL